MEDSRDNKVKKFTFIDLFAGIGGIRLALERAGGKCVFSCEIDPFCQKTYEANFGEKPAGDIRKVDAASIPDHDLLAAGFPCQPFSIAGVSKKTSLGRKHGFEDEVQGNLFFEIERIIRGKRPKILLLENVKHLKNHDRGKTYRIIQEILHDLDFIIFDSILDAKNYTCQHRERIFIVGFSRRDFPDSSSLEFRFPSPPPEPRTSLIHILEREVSERYVLSDHLWGYLQEYAAKHRRKGNGFGFGLIDPSVDLYTRTLSARYHKDGSEILIRRPKGNPRRLTPRECARLMGFPESFRIVVSDTQAYRQFGNSVVVPLVEDIAREIVKAVERYGKSAEKRDLFQP